MAAAGLDFVPSHFFKRYLFRNYRIFSALKFALVRRFTPAGWVLIGGMFVALLLGVDTNLALAYKIYALLGVVMGAALLAPLFFRSRVAVSRSLPRLASVGLPFEYTVSVRNLRSRIERSLGLREVFRDPRPTFEEFLLTPEPGENRRNWYDRTYGYYRWSWLIRMNRQGSGGEAPVPQLAPLGTAETKMSVTPLRRGYMELSALDLVCRDPFGLVNGFIRVPAPQSVLVLPKRYPVGPVQLPGSLKYQQGGVALASSVGESEEFVSLRDYRPGDPLRHVHWRSWAKLDRPVVKEFQDEFFVRHALILDTFTEWPYGDVFEEAVAVASSFAYTVQRNDSLLDLMFVGPRAFCFTSGRGVGHVEQMLEVLACVRACQDQPFQLLHDAVMEHLRAVSGCICVFLGWDEPRQRLVRDLQEMNLPVWVFVVVESGAEKGVGPGPLAGDPGSFHVLPVGKVAEGLARL